MPAKKRILVVDDDRDALALIHGFLAGEKKYDILTARTAEEALDKLEKQEVDLVISDLRMPGMSGTDLLRELRDWDGTLPVIFVSAWGKDREWEEASRDPACQLVSKPFRKEALSKAVHKAFQGSEALSHR